LADESVGVFGNLFKRPLIFLILGILGVGLILFGGKKETVVKKSAAENFVSYGDMLEEKIQELLESMAGITHARVIVTVDGGSEYRYAEIGNGYPSGYLVITDSDGDEAPIVREIYPTVRGVGVVCTGGDSAAVKNRVVSLLSTALGISAGSIEVTGMS